MGYGIIGVRDKKFDLLHFGAESFIKVNKDSMARMQMVFHTSLELMQRFEITEVALEAPFFGKNIQSMLKLGRAQGIALAAALSLNLQVDEYAPRKIKQSITGNGNASKEQVAKMLQTTLKIEEIPLYLDATDGLSVAVCHFYERQSPFGISDDPKVKGWDAFIKKNPGRIKGV